MSGIVGIYHRDGAPVDPDILNRMTGSMRRRGPDAQRIWHDGPVGLGHAALFTTPEAERENQPATLDGQVWITADARIDEWDELRRKLEAKERAVPATVTDVELILHAYHVWGEDCVHHLIGDFAFAIWDGPERRLFCARDHWGLKLLYYATIKDTILVSNDLNCIRLHPDVSSRLNDLAIADFLLFEFNQDLSTTTFADIQRLPPAHTMMVTADAVRPRRYWQLSIDRQIRYRRREDYIDRFRELLHLAVADRVRSNRVAIMMSGGLDSPTIAAEAKRVLAQRSSDYDFQAYTYVYDWLIPDDERHYTTLAADAIGIPVHFVAADDYRLYTSQTALDQPVPEPFHWPIILYPQEELKPVAAGGRVILYGEDGDTLLAPETMAQLLGIQGAFQTIWDGIDYVWHHRRRPPLGLGLQTKIRRWTGKDSEPDASWQYPAWLNPDFERRLNLPGRWKEFMEPGSHPPGTLRPNAYRRLSSPYWQQFAETLDPGITSLAVEYWLPLMDLRLVNYLLSLPALPWCVRKELLREAGRGILPEPIRRRPKSPLSEDPVQKSVRRRPEYRSIEQFTPAQELLEYVLPQRITPLPETDSSTDPFYITVRPMRLNAWLQSIDRYIMTSKEPV